MPTENPLRSHGKGTLKEYAKGILFKMEIFVINHKNNTMKVFVFSMKAFQPVWRQDFQKYTCF